MYSSQQGYFGETLIFFLLRDLMEKKSHKFGFMSFCWLKTPIERNQQSNHFAWNSQPRLTWPMANLFKLFGDSIGKISREQTFISGSRTAKWVGPVSRHPTWEIPPDVGHPISVCRRGWFVLRSESNFVGLGIAGEEPNGLRWKKVNVSWVVVFGEEKNGQICGMNRKQPKKKSVWVWVGVLCSKIFLFFDLVCFCFKPWGMVVWLFDSWLLC